MIKINQLRVMKITWRIFPCVLRNILVIIRNTTGLSFVLKRIGPLVATIYFHCYLFVIALFIITKIPKQLPFSVYSETILRTIYQYLLLLVGFDTLTYWKSYDRSPTLVGHQTFEVTVPLYMFRGKILRRRYFLGKRQFLGEEAVRGGARGPYYFKFMHTNTRKRS